MVNVPQPARFALHKLLISGRRKNLDKRRKDVAHAASLCSVLVEDDPKDLKHAWDALAERGPTWIRGVREAMAKIDKPLADRLKVLFRMSKK